MPGAESSRKHGPDIVTAACLTLIGGAFVSLAVLASNGLFSVVDVVFVAVVVVAAFVGMLFAQAVQRRSAVSTLNPGAFVVQLTGDQGTAFRLRRFARAMGITVDRFLSDNVTIAIDHISIRFYVGGARPQVVLEIPSSRLLRASRTGWLNAFGTPATEVTELEFSSPAGPQTLQLVFAHGLIMRPLHNAALESALVELRAAAGLAPGQ